MYIIITYLTVRRKYTTQKLQEGNKTLIHTGM